MEVFDVYDEAEFDSSFFKMAREGVGALYVTPDQLLPGRTSCLVALLRNIDTSTSELLVSGHRDRRRADDLRSKSNGQASASGCLCRTHLQGCQASRPAGIPRAKFDFVMNLNPPKIPG
jgi:hypothetical protein